VQRLLLLRLDCDEDVAGACLEVPSESPWSILRCGDGLCQPNRHRDGAAVGCVHGRTYYCSRTDPILTISLFSVLAELVQCEQRKTFKTDCNQKGVAQLSKVKL